MGKSRNIIYLICFASVLCIHAVQAEGTNKLGTVYELTALSAEELHLGQFDQAISNINKTLEIDPTADYAYLNRASVYLAMGSYEKSLADFDKYISMNATNAYAFCGRAEDYAKLGKYEKAVADFNKGININAHYVRAFTSRGFCYEKLGRYADAGNDYSNAIQMDFDFADAWNSLAWLRATCPRAEIRNGHEAVGAAIRGCNLTNWDNWMYLDTLAVAYAETGDFDLAVKYENQALQLINPKNKEMDGMKKRLLLFQQKQPYRDDSNSGD